jgi:hypothetical protein
MNQKNYKLSSANYLLQCDLINKYILKNIYQQPKIEKIEFQVFLKDFLISSNFFNKKDINNNIQIKACLFLYLIFNFSPFIIFQLNKENKSLKLRNEGEFIMKMEITDFNHINNFMSNFLIDNHSFYKNFINSSNLLNCKSEHSSFSYNFKLPGSFRYDINDFFLTKIQDIKLGKVKIHSNIVYSNISKNMNVLGLIKNLFFFS